MRNANSRDKNFGRLSFASITAVAAIGVFSMAQYSHKKQAVIGGSPATIADWGGVVGVLYDGGAGCTGSLIAPRVVLTAAHCTKAASDPETADPTAVRFGTADLATGGTDIKVVKVEKTSATGVGEFDLALLFLESDAPVEPYALARDCGAATQGGDVTLVGFGVTDKDTQGVLYSVNLKVGTLACTDVNEGCQTYAGTGSYIVTNPGGMCGGDSGGPLFVVNQYGKFVAGLVSGPTDSEGNKSENCDGWQAAMYPRPDTVVAWIEEKIGSALPTASCTSGSGGTGGSGGTSGSGGTGGTGGTGGSSGSAGNPGVPADSDGGCTLGGGPTSSSFALLMFCFFLLVRTRD